MNYKNKYLPDKLTPTGVDIVMLAYQRAEMTARAIKFLDERTITPYRLFVVDNHSTDGTDKLLKELCKTPRTMPGREDEMMVFHSVRMSRNVGVHMGWNVALSLIDSYYFITMDNDIYVPKLGARDWLSIMVDTINNHHDEYGAIAATPHVFVGAELKEPGEDGLVENNMCGAVVRIMRRDLVVGVGGWEHKWDANRNHEEKTICSRLSTEGFKVGYQTRVTCYHDFGEDNNWGYKDIHPHKHGHRIPGEEIWPPPSHLQTIKQLDQNTWLTK